MLELPGYKLEKELGKGGMATVYLALHEGLHRRVAIKVMTPHHADEFNFGERFMREARIVANLSHQNIVTVHDVNRHNGYHYIAMEYLPGGMTLEHKIKNGLAPQQGLEIIKQMAAALGYAHSKGIVHRDVKPENILFREDGTAVLTDFGIARSTDLASKLTSTGTIIGTAHYMSPEQGHGQETGFYSDIYSLGVVLYETLTGKVPYMADSTIAVILKHVTEPVPTLEGALAIYQPVLNLMMAKNKDDRYRSCAEIINDLNCLATDGKISTATHNKYATVLIPPTGRKHTTLPGANANATKTNTVLIAGLAASLLLMMLLAGYLFFSGQTVLPESNSTKTEFYTTKNCGEPGMPACAEEPKPVAQEVVQPTAATIEEPADTKSETSLPENNPPVNTPQKPITPKPATQSDYARDWVATGNKRFSRGEYFTPANNNAFTAYKKALSYDSEFTPAKNGIENIIASVNNKTRAIASSQGYDAAIAYINEALEYLPQNSSLLDTRKQLVAARDVEQEKARQAEKETTEKTITQQEKPAVIKPEEPAPKPQGAVKIFGSF